MVRHKAKTDPSSIRASVIIPALNASSTISTQLHALATQDVDFAWEVIVVDNGSHDNTVNVCQEFGTLLPSLRIVRCDRPGTSSARNAGASLATSDLFLFCDSDDEVASGWVAAMAARLEHVDAVGGAIESDKLNPGRADYFPRHPDHLPVSGNFLPRAISANLGVRRSAFEDVGGFTESYTYASDDVALCWKLQLAGYSLVYEPGAVLHYRYRDSARGTAIKAYRLGRARPQLFRDFKQYGMPRPHPLSFVRRLLWLAIALLAVPFSPRARWSWLENAAATVGSVAGCIRYREWYI